MSPQEDATERKAHGDQLTAVSDGMVGLLKEFYGRGPTRAKSYYQDDLVVCLLRGGFSRVEQTLLDGGRGTAVIQQRMEFQELMRERFEEVIERVTRRRVIGFMSGNQQNPDLMCEVFVLAPSELVDEHEILAQKPRVSGYSWAGAPPADRDPRGAGGSPAPGL
ncbi:MAG: Na-translocating system protein MpsC family protein [Solirubrobacteraceae bacterium]